ncbi:hypothetical protein [Asticcacaulis excentricus]|uniref:hypothetical protein n=1 Tax=Asticcacaulis excentricus TaxID=78587 RepID=UPI0002ECDB5B|nr:hypothetical protein [Asticcacaulis excentricus]
MPVATELEDEAEVPELADEEDEEDALEDETPVAGAVLPPPPPPPPHEANKAATPAKTAAKLLTKTRVRDILCSM